MLLPCSNFSRHSTLDAYLLHRPLSLYQLSSPLHVTCSHNAIPLLQYAASLDLQPQSQTFRICKPSSEKATQAFLANTSSTFPMFLPPSSDRASYLFHLACCLLTSPERIVIISSEHVETIGNGKRLSEGNL